MTALLCSRLSLVFRENFNYYYIDSVQYKSLLIYLHIISIMSVIYIFFFFGWVFLYLVRYTLVCIKMPLCCQWFSNWFTHELSSFLTKFLGKGKDFTQAMVVYSPFNFGSIEIARTITVLEYLVKVHSDCLINMYVKCFIEMNCF